ncbi:hypothetical protein ACC739_37660, partial [Rhizobium ruizarguesonis]
GRALLDACRLLGGSQRQIVGRIGYNVSVGQTAANAEKASAAVRETQEKAKNSGELVTSAVSAMAGIEKSSTGISKISGVID